MICDLCERPEESHPCTKDLTKLLAENNKQKLQLDEFRKLLQQWMDASNLAKDITFVPIYKRTEFSLSTEEQAAPWTNEQKAALAEVAETMLKVHQKQQGE
jgi:hypothetical protein